MNRERLGRAAEYHAGLRRRGRLRVSHQTLPDGRAGCTHAAEAHIIYDRLAAGWRVVMTCRCGKIENRGRRLYDALIGAEAAVKALVCDKPGYTSDKPG